MNSHATANLYKITKFWTENVFLSLVEFVIDTEYCVPFTKISKFFHFINRGQFLRIQLSTIKAFRRQFPIVNHSHLSWKGDWKKKCYFWYIPCVSCTTILIIHVYTNWCVKHGASFVWWTAAYLLHFLWWRAAYLQCFIWSVFAYLQYFVWWIIAVCIWWAETYRQCFVWLAATYFHCVVF